MPLFLKAESYIIGFKSHASPDTWVSEGHDLVDPLGNSDPTNKRPKLQIRRQHGGLIFFVLILRRTADVQEVKVLGVQISSSLGDNLGSSVGLLNQVAASN